MFPSNLPFWHGDVNPVITESNQTQPRHQLNSNQNFGQIEPSIRPLVNVLVLARHSGTSHCLRLLYIYIYLYLFIYMYFYPMYGFILVSQYLSKSVRVLCLTQLLKMLSNYRKNQIKSHKRKRCKIAEEIFNKIDFCWLPKWKYIRKSTNTRTYTHSHCCPHTV